MNRPTTILKITYALLMAGGLLTSCSSDDDTVQTKVMEAGKTYTMTVTASKGNNEAAAIKTRALSLDGNTLSATWATTEQVFFRDRDSELQYSGNLKPQSEGKTVLLNGIISPSATLVLPIDIKLIFPKKDWDYTGQVGTLADIAKNYDYATAEADIRNIEANHIEAAKSVKFENQQSIVKFTLKDNANATVNVSSLRISAKGLVKNIDEPLDDEEFGDEEFGDIIVKPTSATSEVFAALRGINGAQVTLTATVDDDFYIFKRDNVTFGNGTYRSITVKMRKIDYRVALANVTEDHIGSVVGQDGYVYPNASAAENAGTNAVAMIAYVGNESGCTHGLAIALNDDGKMTQDEAKTAASSHAVDTEGTYTWRLPTIDDWQYMLIGCGNGATYFNSTVFLDDKPDIVDYTALNSKLATVGTALNNDGSNYWSSDNNYYCPLFNIDGSCNLSVTDPSYGNSEHYARAVLAF